MTLLALVLPALLAVSPTAVLRWDTSTGDLYDVQSFLTEKRLLNGQLVDTVEVRNQAVLTVEKVRGEEALLAGDFLYYSRNLDRGEPFRLVETYPSRFWRDRLGRFRFEQEYFMPTVRSVPTLPEGPVEPGDMWEAPGEEVHDFRPYGVQRAFRAPLTARYHYLGEVREDGKRLGKISISTVVHHTVPRALRTGDLRQPVRMTGSTMATYFWDLDENCPYRQEEMFHFVVELASGDVQEFIGKGAGRSRKLRRVSERERREMADTIREELDRKQVPAEVTADERGIHIDVGEVFFEHDSARLTRDARDGIARIARILEEYGEFEIVVEGHTDSTGTREYNQNLSGQRARAVAGRLLGEGQVDRERLSYRGLGEEQPKASNDTPEGRARNRRVEIIIITH